MINNEEGGIDAWIGVIAAGLFAVFYYVAVLPVWRGIYNMVIPTITASSLFDAGFYNYLRWILDWAPVIFVIIALFWAFVSPIRREGVSWREM
jgi:hypothetical protein